MQKSKRKYRVRRVDKRNFAIQKLKIVKGEEIWVNISFHGNNLKSVTSGILDVAMSGIFPEGDDLKLSVADLASQWGEVSASLEEQIKQKLPNPDHHKIIMGKTYLEFDV